MDSVIGFHPQPGVGGTLASFTQKKNSRAVSDWSGLGQVPFLDQSVRLGGGDQEDGDSHWST